MPSVTDPYHANYDVLPEGRFVFVREAGARRRATFTVVLNQFDHLAQQRRQRQARQSDG